MTFPLEYFDKISIFGPSAAMLERTTLTAALRGFTFSPTAGRTSTDWLSVFTLDRSRDGRQPQSRRARTLRITRTKRWRISSSRG